MTDDWLMAAVTAAVMVVVASLIARLLAQRRWRSKTKPGQAETARPPTPAEPAPDEAQRLALQQARREVAQRRADRERLRAEAQARAQADADADAERHRLQREAVRIAALAAAARRVDPGLKPNVALPAAAAEPAGPMRTPQSTLVLVADDSRLVRVKTSRLLAEHGYRVELAVDGLDALRCIEAERPAVLITDVEMPGLDGFALSRRLRGDARTASLPIIMITAADDRHRDEAAAVGVDRVLGKPYADEDLIACIESTLEATSEEAFSVA